jgi:hypothetical protein
MTLINIIYNMQYDPMPTQSLARGAIDASPAIAGRAN